MPTFSDTPPHPSVQPGQRHHFGRLQRFDPQSQNYLIRKNRLSMWKILTAAVKTRVTHHAYWHGDQGETSQCTAYSTLGAWEAMAHPRSAGKALHGYPRPILDPAKLYHEAQELDPWPGSETEDPKYEGSSVTAASDAMKTWGLIAGYDWEFSDITVCERAIFIAPLVFGIDWKSGMMLQGAARTRWEDAVVHNTGSVVGGHAIACVGYDKTRQGAEFELMNSWGLSWGLKGHCFIGRDDLGALLAAQGECSMMRMEPDSDVEAAMKVLGGV